MWFSICQSPNKNWLIDWRKKNRILVKVYFLSSQNCTNSIFVDSFLPASSQPFLFWKFNRSSRNIFLFSCWLRAKYSFQARERDSFTQVEIVFPSYLDTVQLQCIYNLSGFVPPSLGGRNVQSLHIWEWTIQENFRTFHSPFGLSSTFFSSCHS